MKVEILKSHEDDSVNFVFSSATFPGFFEARYVRRSSRKMAIYLSSQSGCTQACRMCHLTATGQKKLVNSGPADYLDQAMAVFDWYDKNCEKAEMVHFNFMARGEALANPAFLEHGQELFNNLGEQVIKRGLQARFLVSTIMPKCFGSKSLGKYFPVHGPEIYYSIYSVKEEFRRKWLPQAMPVQDAFVLLKKYHDETKKVVRIHWAFIEGENDSEEDMVLLCHAIRRVGLNAEIRIVRYNPYNENYGQESDMLVIKRNIEILRTWLPFSHVKMISRVGPDVKASCGMFVEPGFVQIQKS